MPCPLVRRSIISSVDRQELDLTLEPAVGLELPHQVLVRLDPPDGEVELLREDLRLQVVVVEHVARRRRRRTACSSSLRCSQREFAARSARPSRIFRLTSWSEHVDAGGVVDEVGVDAVRRASAYSMRPRCVKPRLPPSPTTRARSVAAVDAHRVVRAVADLAVRLVRRLHVGADAAVPQQVDRRPQDGLDQLVRRQLPRPRCRAPRAPRATAGSTSSARDQTPPPGEIFDAS